MANNDNAAVMAVCPICWEEYDNEAQIREVLPCGHSLCSVCLPNLETRRCPQCRTPIDGPEQNDFSTSDDRSNLVRSEDAEANAAALDDTDTCSRICRSLIIPFSTTNAKGTLILTAVMFFLVMFICCVIRIPAVAQTMAQSTWLCENLIPHSASGKINCAAVIGNLAIYRVGFFFFLFVFLYSIVMLITPKNTVVFDQVRNGFWLFKWLLMFFFIIVSFFVKNSSNEAIMVMGFVGAFALNILQIGIIAGLGNEINTRVRRLVRNLLTSFCYGLALFYAFFIIWFYCDGATCTTNKWLIGANVVLCALLALIKISTQSERTGLLSVSLITVFVMHLTWSALSNIPDKTCNPLLMDDSPFHPLTSFESALLWTQTAVSLIILFICVGYALHFPSMLQFNFFCEVLSGAAALCAMMTLTYWFKPDGDLLNQNGHMAAVWVKMTSSWIGLLISCCLFDSY